MRQVEETTIKADLPQDFELWEMGVREYYEANPSVGTNDKPRAHFLLCKRGRHERLSGIGLQPG
jgi:hypothetical protein